MDIICNLLLCFLFVCITVVFLDLSGFQENEHGEIIKTICTEQASFFPRVLITAIPAFMLIFGAIEVNSWLVYFSLTQLAGCFSYPNFPTPKDVKHSFNSYLCFWVTETCFSFLRSLFPVLIFGLIVGLVGTNAPATAVYELMGFSNISTEHFHIPWSFVFGAAILLVIRGNWLYKSLCTPEDKLPIYLFIFTYLIMFAYLINVTQLVPSNQSDWGNPTKGILGALVTNFLYSYWFEVVDKNKKYE